MSNQEELTDQQAEALEIKERNEIRKAIKISIKMGKALEKLKKNPDFKEIFLELYVKTGKEYLWENINNIAEEQMIKRVPQEQLDRGMILKEKLEKQVHGRLIFVSFLDTIEHDYENAVEALAEMDAEANKEEA